MQYSYQAYGEMAELIAYFTHLEGRAVYAACDERLKGNAVNNDPDYVLLKDATLIKKYINRHL